jgi:hypothetical protein
MQAGAALNMTNNCFINNKFSGFGTVLAFNSTPYNGNDNYGTPDAELACPYLVKSTVLPETVDEIECLQFDVTECLLPGVSAPSRAPTSSTDPPTVHMATTSSSRTKLSRYALGTTMVALAGLWFL